MYEAFYGFRERPFSMLPDPGFLYFSRKHRVAYDLLEYGLLNQAGFNVITGEIGTGKTTLVRHLLAQLGEDVRVGIVSNTHASFGELLQWILLAFNVEYQSRERVDMYSTFVRFLDDVHEQGQRALLIVDEAQNMNAEMLEELRMLSNVNADKDQLLQVILVGQVGLRDMLRRPGLEQFAQRIAVDYHLEPLDKAETGAYIRHRLAIASGAHSEESGGDSGASGSGVKRRRAGMTGGAILFDDAACDAIWEHSGGIPRVINMLCDTALVYGFAEQKRRIDAELVDDVAYDKERGGLFVSQKGHHADSDPVGAHARGEPARPTRDQVHDDVPPARREEPRRQAARSETVRREKAPWEDDRREDLRADERRDRDDTRRTDETRREPARREEARGDNRSEPVMSFPHIAPVPGREEPVVAPLQAVPETLPPERIDPSGRGAKGWSFISLDSDIVNYLKNTQAELYAKIKAAVMSSRGKTGSQ